MDIVEKLRIELASLPKGYISNKTIGGKVRHYLQWTENGKIKSRYIKDSEYEEIKAKIARRKELAEHLKSLEKAAPLLALEPSFTAETVGEGDIVSYNATGGYNRIAAITGDRLDRLVAEPSKLDTRDCFSDIEEYLHGPWSPRIMVVYGLRRTGKTTLLFQAIGKMDSETRKKAFYIKAQKGQTMAGLYDTIDRLSKAGYKYAFIDEITFIDDFIDTASALADIYAAGGMKIVVSGTDSLGFWLAERNELYDRTFTIHTTRISFAEHSRLLHTDDIDDYIRFGGTLRAGEYDFDDPELRDESVSFRDDESTRRYIDTAICRNIQHSLKCYESGTRFMHLKELYDSHELTNAINRIIEDMNHRFVLSVLKDDFRSGDFSLAEKNLLRERNPALRTNILQTVDRGKITERLMQILDIKNASETVTELKPAHVREIRAYLEALDLIDSIPVRYASGAGDEDDSENVVVTQPGMRYCQAEALVRSLKKDAIFAELSEAEKDYVIEKILDDVKGRMLEEIVLTEAIHVLSGRGFDVFKYQFIGGEIDMIVYDKKNGSCRLYEIKHGTVPVREQCRHLLDERNSGNIRRIFGEIAGKAVIYRGEPMCAEWGVDYLNANEFLRGIRDFGE
ncbi:MAG: AAA family ATPase [Clostridia bacterium]|nr:AAA family ATPase [Clostridia bacterium]